jgi:hypothetical protein
VLIDQAQRGHCDLVAHAQGRGYAFDGSSRFVRDDGAALALSSLLPRRPNQSPITFTAVPPEEGRRAGIDRDEDGVLDAFER